MKYIPDCKFDISITISACATARVAPTFQPVTSNNSIFNVCNS